ncbi:hypothetical protein EJV47_08415 [Hymenobacter gummosus]|uniref:DUF5034 domain-containing protein n=1 Tax=Hymenobacter gummosus TaxID=1776032 RepID=A0A3S0H7I2_9BACT|nr:hypothetical protein [Hymenobacter gummosus]RTQ50648.1 hypothetical protein EJV47_08415 [Hymenobacter gummosus]
MLTRRPALKLTLLAILTGLTLPACELLFGDRKYYCGGGHRYVDVEGVELRAYQEPVGASSVTLAAGQRVVANQLQLHLGLQERRYGAVPARGGFVAWADCIEPEYSEQVDSVSIFSRYDYDARHPAGTPLNDIVQVLPWPSAGPPEPGTPPRLLSQVLGQPGSVRGWQAQRLKLTVGPAQAGPQQFRLRYHQTNGEAYVAETPLLTVVP